MSLDMFDLPDITSDFDFGFNDPASAEIPLLTEAQLKEFDFLGDLALPDIDLGNKNATTVQDAPSTSEPCGSGTGIVDGLDTQLIAPDTEPVSPVSYAPRSGEQTFQTPQLSSQHPTQNLYHLDPTSHRLVPVPSDRVYSPCSPPPGYQQGDMGPPPEIAYSTQPGPTVFPNHVRKRQTGLEGEPDDSDDLEQRRRRASKKPKRTFQQPKTKSHPDSPAARREYHKLREARKKSVRRRQQAQADWKSMEEAALEKARMCELEQKMALERANSYRRRLLEMDIQS